MNADKTLAIGVLAAKTFNDFTECTKFNAATDALIATSKRLADSSEVGPLLQ